MLTLWTRLGILGFNACSFSSLGLDFKTPLSTQHQCDGKYFELIAYYLFQQLNPSLAMESFSSCYPSTNLKESREFLNAAFHWLSGLKGFLKHPWLVRKSVLQECNGAKMELLLVDLADYLVKLKLQKSGLVPFSGNNDFDLALKIEKQNFLTRSKRQAQQQRLWLGQAEELKLRISRLLTRKASLLSSSSSIPFSSSFSSSSSLLPISAIPTCSNSESLDIPMVEMDIYRIYRYVNRLQDALSSLPPPPPPSSTLVAATTLEPTTIDDKDLSTKVVKLNSSLKETSTKRPNLAFPLYFPLNLSTSESENESQLTRNYLTQVLLLQQLNHHHHQEEEEEEEYYEQILDETELMVLSEEDLY